MDELLEVDGWRTTGADGNGYVDASLPLPGKEEQAAAEQ
jgi:hypothetical protein